jgi:hypothetical protein
MIITYNGNIVKINNQIVNFGSNNNNINNLLNYFIYVSGELTDGNTVWKYDIDGNLVSSLSSVRRIRGLTVDSEDNIIMVGDSSSTAPNENFYKYDFNGNLLFFKRTINGTAANRVKVDSNDNIFIVSTIFNSISLMKYDKDGNLIWQGGHTASVSDLTIDSNDNVIIGGTNSAGISVRKYSNSGTLIWSAQHGNTILGVDFDSQNNILATGIRTNVIGGVNNTTRKYDGNTGALLFSIDHGQRTDGIAVDSKDNFIIAGGRINNVGIRKFDSNGNTIWAIDYPTDIGTANPNTVLVDNDDNIFVSVPATSLNKGFLFKFNSDGELLSTITRDNLIYNITLSNK